MSNTSFSHCTAGRICVALAALMAAHPAFAQSASTTPAFPEVSKSYLKTGDFIAPDHVRRVTSAMNKDQVRLELGNPHFSEGIGQVREWDYVFNFYTGSGNDFVTCQYKVVFDAASRVVSTHWKNPDCQAYLTPPKTEVVVRTDRVPPQPETVVKRRVSLSSDGLFAFGKSSLEDMTPASRQKLRQLADQLGKSGARVLTASITGHTDRIGSEADNLELSQARAESVRAFLVQAGASPQAVQARGLGESQPVVNCDGVAARAALVECLQPNRRVEIEITGEE